jgi:hypothetical protein
MAKTKKKTTTRKAKSARGGRKGSAKRRQAKTRRPARAAASGAASRRVAELEAENRRLREEIAELRSRISSGGDMTAAEDTSPGLGL